MECGYNCLYEKKFGLFFWIFIFFGGSNYDHMYYGRFITANLIEIMGEKKKGLTSIQVIINHVKCDQIFFACDCTIFACACKY
jgi:hypothetical protein